MTTIFITDDHRIFAFGDNIFGPLNFDGKNRDESKRVYNPNEYFYDPEIVRVISSKSSNHTLIYKKNGNLFGCGYNESGQLGLPRTQEVKNSLILNDKSIQIIACEGYQSFVFKTNSKILSLRYSWSTRKSVNLVFQDKISKISCGGSHSVFYTENGKVFVMGCNSSGQLGIGKDKGKVGALEDTKPILLLTDKTIKDIICGEIIITKWVREIVVMTIFTNQNF
jgi:hypothetical protein